MAQPPSEPVVIETVCNGSPHGEGYTDAKGYFSHRARVAEFGDDSGCERVQLARAVSEMGFVRGPRHRIRLSAAGSDSAERKYMGCDLQAKLSGYRSQTVALAGRRPWTTRMSARS